MTDVWSTADPTLSPAEKMHVAVWFSERRRVDARLRMMRVRERERAALLRERRSARVLPPPTEVELAVRGETAVNRDELWRAAVTDEQWGQRLTVQYALLEFVAQQTATNRLLGEVVRLLTVLVPGTVGRTVGPPQDRT